MMKEEAFPTAALRISFIQLLQQLKHLRRSHNETYL